MTVALWSLVVPRRCPVSFHSLKSKLLIWTKGLKKRPEDMPKEPALSRRDIFQELNM